MEKSNNKNKFVIGWSTCILVLVLMFYFGISNNSSTLKGTSAANSNCDCPEGTLSENVNADGNYYCTTNVGSLHQVDLKESQGWSCGDYTTSGYLCTKDAECTTSTPGKVTIQYAANGGTIKSQTESSNGIVYKWKAPFSSSAYDLIFISENAGISYTFYTQSVNYGSSFNSEGIVNYNNEEFIYITPPTGYANPPEGQEWKCMSGNCKKDIYAQTGSIAASDLCDASNGDCTVTLGVNWQQKKCYSCFSNSNMWVWSGSKPDHGSNGCKDGWTLKGNFKTEDDCLANNKYTISYNANNGSGAPSSQTKTYGVDLTLSDTRPTRSGYDFLGWSKSPTATSATYQPGGKFTENENATLFAVWKKDSSSSTTTLKANFYKSDNATSAYYTDDCTTTTGNNYCLVDVPSSEPTKTGHTFIGWREANNSCTAGSIYTTSKIKIYSNDVDFYPCFEEESPKPSSSTPKPPSSTPKPSSSTPKPSTGTIIKPSSTTTKAPSSNSNVSENPGTGQIAIFVVWTIALASIVYSIWYFRKIKSN